MGCRKELHIVNTCVSWMKRLSSVISGIDFDVPLQRCFFSITPKLETN